MSRKFKVIANNGDHVVFIGSIVEEITEPSEHVSDIMFERGQQIVSNFAREGIELVHVLAYGNTPQVILRAELEEV